MFKTRHRTSPSHPVLKDPENRIDELFSEICGIKTEEELNKAVDSLLEWVGLQNHFVVKDIEREYIEATLYGTKGSIEMGKQVLDKRLTYTNLMPEVLTNIDLVGGFKDMLSYYMFAPMPICKDKFYRLTVNKFYGNVEKLCVNDLIKYWVAGMEYHIMQDAVIGVESIFDFEEANLSDIIVKFTPAQIKKIVTILTAVICHGECKTHRKLKTYKLHRHVGWDHRDPWNEDFPIFGFSFQYRRNGYRTKVKAIHILSGSKMVDTLLVLMKSVLSAKLSSRVHVYSSKESIVESIGKEYLPSDYGGVQLPLAELHARYYAELTSERHLQHMATVQTYRTDETRRLASTFNEEYAGMPGSFRSLSVD